MKPTVEEAIILLIGMAVLAVMGWVVWELAGELRTVMQHTDPLVGAVRWVAVAIVFHAIFGKK